MTCLGGQRYKSYAPGIATNGTRKRLGAPSLATRSKEATSNKGHRYWEQGTSLLVAT